MIETNNKNLQKSQQRVLFQTWFQYSVYFGRHAEELEALLYCWCTLVKEAPQKLCCTRTRPDFQLSITEWSQPSPKIELWLCGPADTQRSCFHACMHAQRYTTDGADSSAISLLYVWKGHLHLWKRWSGTKIQTHWCVCVNPTSLFTVSFAVKFSHPELKWIHGSGKFITGSFVVPLSVPSMTHSPI